MVDDVKAQLRYIEDYNELESRRREESTMESLNKASKCKARFSQPEYLEMKKKVKKWRQENEDQVRNKESNETALAALGRVILTTNRNYVIDMFKMTTLVTQHDARKAGSEVVKQVDHPLLGGLLYPCLQALDEEYLKVDAQFGGVDQRKIFTFAEKYLPQLGYAKRAHLMNPMGHYFPLIVVPGLTGGKMSASDIDSKIDFLDPPKVVQNKIRKAFCMPGSLEDNGVLAFLKMVVFPILDFKSVKVFFVESPELGTVEYLSYEQVEEDFLSLKLHPADVKAALSREINYLLAPILKAFESPKMQKIVTSAYPGDNKARVVTPTVESVVSDPTVCDFRVGKIISVKKNADSLFVERVDVGGGRILTICSSLVNSCTEEELSGNNFVFLVNLKPANLRGIMSEGMIMCAKVCGDVGRVEPLIVPEQSQAGDVVYFDGFPPQTNQVQLNAKKKVLPRILTKQEKVNLGNTIAHELFHILGFRHVEATEGNCTNDCLMNPVNLIEITKYNNSDYLNSTERYMFEGNTVGECEFLEDGYAYTKEVCNELELTVCEFGFVLIVIL
ncbi:tyrosine--tRNA ligase, cytoplasmic-like [Octopus sinensis]|uniref:Tyrosine--tRNA ligase, cytoplasmic-like n=1 Tax=Octopus sinensis TaxID=2607531 RepID=A0A6P7TY44_9MOLL|nr:tyrosine--tRNA ligase, cytoplasmic-like [Octopus sinensis]